MIYDKYKWLIKEIVCNTDLDMQPQKRLVRIVTMSDTHDVHFRIDIKSLPPADIFIHAGDFTKFSTVAQLARFRQFLGLLPYKHKIVIAGNHDFALDRTGYQNLKKTKHGNIPEVDTELQISKLKKVCTYLEHQLVQVEGIKIFGSPYSLQFHNWGFMYAKKDAFKLWSVIPEDTDVLVTHGPPFEILDRNYDKTNVGCQSLRQHVLRIKPKLHIFGHIHEDYGVKQLQGITFVNACSVNLAYKLTNPPLYFEITPKA